MIQKSKVLLAGFLLLVSSMAFSQITVGGRLGLNLANLRGSSIQNNSMLIGYNVGGLVNYSMEDILSGDIADIMTVQAELSIQNKGTTQDFPSVDENFNPTTISVKQVFTYVQVPVLAKFTFETNSDLKYFGEGGFFLGSLFGLTIDGEKGWDHDGNPSTDKRKYREEYSGFDFGVLVGGGVQYPLPFGGRSQPFEAFADVRYALGLNSIGEAKDKTPEILVEGLKDIKTNTISILFGVLYKL
ncbi:MAG: PorT family protein [Bacteroidales bacterium]|nr:PorT family protein [Bacteroidales bacterium]MCF8405930.1 PorT family protein [Bacteroidales bacterium]